MTASADPGRYPRRGRGVEIIQAHEADDTTRAALGKLGEALEYLDRCRGALVEFHQHTGRVDALLQEAAEGLDEAGHPDQARVLWSEAVGRNVLQDRWTFQIIEEYEDGYEHALRAAGSTVRAALAGGRRHVHEAELKRRTQDLAARRASTSGDPSD